MPKPSDFSTAEENKRKQIAAAIAAKHPAGAKSSWGIATSVVRKMRRHGATKSLRAELARNRAEVQRKRQQKKAAPKARKRTATARAKVRAKGRAA